VYHGPARWLESGEKVGDPPRTRTLNPEIRSTNKAEPTSTHEQLTDGKHEEKE
jgi:hypothetical protein